MSYPYDMMCRVSEYWLISIWSILTTDSLTTYCNKYALVDNVQINRFILEKAVLICFYSKSASSCNMLIVFTDPSIPHIWNHVRRATMLNIENNATILPKEMHSPLLNIKAIKSWKGYNRGYSLITVFDLANLNDWFTMGVVVWIIRLKTMKRVIVWTSNDTTPFSMMVETMVCINTINM